MTVELVPILVLCLAGAAAVGTLFTARPRSVAARTPDGSRRVAVTHLMAQLAVALFGLAVGFHVVRDLGDYPHRALQPLDWLAGLAAVTAVAIHLWEPAARFPVQGLYVLGVTLVGMLLIQRDLSPGRFLAWTSICELTGFTLVAAMLGWALQRFPRVVTVLRIPGESARWSGVWFSSAQAVLVVSAVAFVGWILLDPAFEALGEGTALLGLAGHRAGCPAALMLVGTTIVMAWQTRGTWRAIWQYAALAAGVLFTSSIGWARLDAATAAPWSRRVIYLLMSASMMTLLTGFGLARVLPHSGDWLIRARRATVVFGGLALLLAAVSLVQWAVS
ncbi:MAG: hypothetical protein ACYC3X_23820 [Pirellulaceae bacterium]